MWMNSIFAIAAAFSKSRAKKREEESACGSLVFESLYEEQFAFVWRTVRALGVPSAAVDDAVQEVFIVLHRRIPDYKPTASVRSWVFGVVRRVAKDFRRAGRRRGILVEVNDTHIRADAINPYISATRNQALAIVEDFARTLDEERRAVFVLSELEQMPVPEIASALALNLNTVYSRVRALRQGLQRFVAERVGETKGDFYE